MSWLAPLAARSNLARTSSYDPFDNFRGEMDRLMDQFFGQTGFVPSPSNPQPIAHIRMNIAETAEGLKLKAELPGMEEKDIEVTLQDQTLTIRGEKRAEKEEKDTQYHLLECSYGSFSRSIRLPFRVKEEDIQARFANGVLSIELPKPKDARGEARKIPLKGK
jgi:HSP20 family protein